MVGVAASVVQHIGAAQLGADAEALHDAQADEQDGSPETDLVVGGQQADQQRAQAHQHERGHQDRPAADLVAEMGQDEAADRAGGETDRKRRERGQGGDEFGLPGEEHLVEDECGR